MNSKIMKMMVSALALASFCLMGCESTEINPGPDVKDADGNVYPTVKIGNQVWTAKNMNVKVAGSKCAGNEPSYCEKYGRLYTWDAAMRACPTGWHLPSMDEFETLLVSVLGEPKVYGDTKDFGKSKKLRSKTGWDVDVVDDDGTDNFGFAVLPAGRMDKDATEFYDSKSSAHFWTSTSVGNGLIAAYDVNVNKYMHFGGDSGIKDIFLSVRCLQD